MASNTNMNNSIKPTLAMIFVQTSFVATLCYKLALNDGMHIPILVAYRFMFAAAFIVPIAFYVERNIRPVFTWKIASYGFVCGLLGGSLAQNLNLHSLALTSATFATAMMNLIPAITFIIAVCLRLESLGWSSKAGKAKVFGTILGISGAMLLTYYKGPELKTWNTNINLLESHPLSHHHGTTPSTPSHRHHLHHDLALGALLSLASCVCYSLWLIVQTKATEEYPCPYTITAMMTVWASIQAVVFAVSTEKSRSSWIMGWDIWLLAVVIGGVFATGVVFTLMTWCIRMRGPLFVSMFNPLALIMVAIAGSFLLEEKLHLGMLLGSILIVGGLYLVLWGIGKEREETEVRVIDPTPSVSGAAAAALAI